MDVTVFYIKLGQKIKAKRKECGVSSIKLATKLNITQQQFNRYERGFSKISLHHLVALSQLLDTPVEWFLHKQN